MHPWFSSSNLNRVQSKWDVKEKKNITTFILRQRLYNLLLSTCFQYRLVHDKFASQPSSSFIICLTHIYADFCKPVPVCTSIYIEITMYLYLADCILIICTNATVLASEVHYVKSGLVCISFVPIIKFFCDFSDNLLCRFIQLT